MNDRVAEAIKHRHPKEWVFFWLIALLTVAALLILLLLAIFRTEVIEMLETDYIEGYRRSTLRRRKSDGRGDSATTSGRCKRNVGLGFQAVRASRCNGARWVLRFVCVPNRKIIWKPTGGGCAYYARAVSRSPIKCGRAWPLPRD